MSNAFNERANALAEEYWKLKERIRTGGPEEKRLEEIEKLLKKGIGGKLGIQLKKEAEKLRSEKEEKKNAQSRFKQIENDLLELTANFAPNLDVIRGNVFPYDEEHEPISEEYFRALTSIIFGEESPFIEFNVAKISERGIEISLPISNDLDAFRVLNYITTILQESAKKLLGIENLFDKSWDKVKQRDLSSIIFKILMESEKELTSEDIQAICHMEDRKYAALMADMYDRRLEEDIEFLSGNEWEYPLIERGGEGYRVTDFGRWVWYLCNPEMNIEKGRKVTENSKSIQRILKLFKSR
ncbi:MAG: hypothetical protein ACXQS7_04870 [Candidatus Syntropharchaeia archaeon]